LQKRKENKKMKVILSLAILVATLLLFTNMAFAPPQCDQTVCYNITATYEDGNKNTDYWEVCLNNFGTGSLHSNNASTYYNLYLFGGGPGWFNTSGSPAIGGNPVYTAWIAWGEYESGFLQPIGDGAGADGYMLTGEGESNGNRYTVLGMKVPCLSCNPGYTKCGAQCVNLNNDPNNCGECGNVCDSVFECSGGHCNLN
jgi:hypothetical protein